jgi:hypothetical protein
MRDDLVFTSEAAAHCHLSPRTLEKRRVKGDGPPFYKVGRRVLYRLGDLDEWIARGRRLSTSDPGELQAATREGQGGPRAGAAAAGAAVLGSEDGPDTGAG